MWKSLENRESSVTLLGFIKGNNTKPQKEINSIQGKGPSMSILNDWTDNKTLNQASLVHVSYCIDSHTRKQNALP